MGAGATTRRCRQLAARRWFGVEIKVVDEDDTTLPPAMVSRKASSWYAGSG